MRPRQVFRAYDTRGAPLGVERFCPRCGAELSTTRTAAGGSTCPRCAHVVYRNAAPAVSVVVGDGARILLCRRSATAYRGGLWCLPCGFVDYDEDFLTAGRREVREETGLEIEVRSIISVVTNFHSPELHTLVGVLDATVIGGELAAGDDVDAVSWHEEGQVMPPLAFEADEHIIARYRAQPIAGAPVEPLS